MPVHSFDDVGFGDELPECSPDLSLETVRCFTGVTGMSYGRFNDHEEARKLGLPGALVPGIMSQGIFAAMIHNWAPGSEIRSLDTIFRAPLVADTAARFKGVVTDCNDERRTLELDVTLSNEAGDTVVLGTAIVALPD